MQGQAPHPENYFRSPLDFPIRLAGNFGEIRSNHFHAGLDMKTESVEGKNIHAAASGYVSRIKISPYGYGKALYITHPNGYVTVYAHLKRFNDRIEAYVKKQQYAARSYEINKFPLPSELPVDQGEVIAFGGNTGGSSGPHLHFEIRNAITGYTVNPLLFGMPIVDSVKPVIHSVRVYPLTNESHVNNSHAPVYLDVHGKSGNYNTSSTNPVKVQGEIGFSLEAYDFLNYSHNKCGIYSIELQKDGKRVYYHEMESFGFHETRYISAHIDYEEYKGRGRHLQKNFIAPNNRLGIYRETLNRGRLAFDDLQIHEMKYIVKDAYGNTSTLIIPVQGQLYVPPRPAEDMVRRIAHEASNTDNVLYPADTGLVNKEDDSGGSEPNAPESMGLVPSLHGAATPANFIKRFPWQYENTFSTNDISIFLDAGILYDDLDFQYQVSDTIIGAIAPTHHIHNPYTPVHEAYGISIRTAKLPERLRSKAMVARIEKGQTYYEGGRYDGDFIKTTSKYFGGFTVLLDTIPPRVKGLNIYEGKDMSRVNTIVISVDDKLSGIDTYNAYLDGNWILMEYEPKKSTLLFSFDDLGNYAPALVSGNGKKGSHTFKAVVTDNRGNESILSMDFLR